MQKIGHDSDTRNLISFAAVPHRGYRSQPKVSHCIWRKGFLRNRISGANGWRPTGFSGKQGKREEAPAFAIRELWAPALARAPWFKFTQPADCTCETCFACGICAPLDRAHIVARSEGGSDRASNLHLLCRMCHELSEALSGISYWRWFRVQSRAAAMHYGAAMAVYKATGRPASHFTLSTDDMDALTMAYARGIDSRWNAAAMGRIAAALLLRSNFPTVE